LVGLVDRSRLLGLMNPVSYLGIRIGSKWDTTTVEQGRRANIGLLSWVKYTSTLGHPLGL